MKSEIVDELIKRKFRVLNDGSLMRTYDLAEPKVILFINRPDKNGVETFTIKDKQTYKKIISYEEASKNPILKKDFDEIGLLNHLKERKQ